MARAHRPTVSMRGLTYQRLRKLAAELHEEGWIGAPANSAAIEWLIHEECTRRRIPEETVLQPRQKANTGPKPGSGKHGGIFTF